ncbi:hypothetical protein CW740_09515 [Kangiella profundi]|uniref:Uncharacterized protein n=1 Tax=Kangiella profundi TaxID=1561924 RepID=A0A2K9AKJ5_9GAMM|nr:hypothetical protein [Kangiella profundi]AUD79464.1 hypothetical protein CW740_09515 [Kangiella profundi]GGE98246.1 hypothetical protein GCM10011356_10080 [Kangiella profundi]
MEKNEIDKLLSSIDAIDLLTLYLTELYEEVITGKSACPTTQNKFELMFKEAVPLRRMLFLNDYSKNFYKNLKANSNFPNEYKLFFNSCLHMITKLTNRYGQQFLTISHKLFKHPNLKDKRKSTELINLSTNYDLETLCLMNYPLLLTIDYATSVLRKEEDNTYIIFELWGDLIFAELCTQLYKNYENILDSYKKTRASNSGKKKGEEHRLEGLRLIKIYYSKSQPKTKDEVIKSVQKTLLEKFGLPVKSYSTVSNWVNYYLANNKN